MRKYKIDHHSVYYVSFPENDGLDVIQPSALSDDLESSVDEKMPEDR